jgi:hypothetical protein
MPFNFRIVGDKVFTLDISPDSTILEVKHEILKLFPTYRLEILKIIHHSTLLPDSLSLRDANVAPTEYIVVQPASRRPLNPPKFARDLPPPIPGGKTTPDKPAPRILPILSTAPLVANNPENAARLQHLLDMGFRQVDAETAFFRALGNIERATDMLLRGNVEPIPDPANRHRIMLANDSGTFEFVVRDVLQHLTPELREAVMNEPAILLREFGLDPSAFDCEGVKQRIQQAPQRDEMQERMQQFSARANEREQLINRLMEAGRDLGRDIVTTILDSVGGDEARAMDLLRQMG